MSNTTYSKTTLMVTRKDGTVMVLQAGQGIRLFDGPFGDAVILGFTAPHGTDNTVDVKIARPYAEAHCIGTTCPSVMTGVEVFNTTLSRLLTPGTTIFPPEQGVFVGGRLANPVDRPYKDEKIEVQVNL